MSVRNVREAVTRVTADRVIDKDDAQAIIDSAGSKISADELAAVLDAFQASGGAYTLTSEAVDHANAVLTDVVQAQRYGEYLNAKVAAAEPLLAAEEKARLLPGVPTTTLGGSAIPEEVKAVVNKALENGALSYDVRAVDDVEKDEAHGGYHVPGRYSPYPQELDATGNLAFDYTEITPEKVKVDMETEQTFKVLKGYKDESWTDPRTGKTDRLRVAEYEEVTMKGSGSISAHYDEASHSEPFARNRDGDKFSSNFAILSDGSFHAVPVMRRNEASRGLILTNPSLGRGQRMLFNGHITMDKGVVTSIGLSGRLHKLVADGDAKMLNPLPLLQAWGFEVSPNLRVRMEGSHGPVNVDDDRAIIEAP